MILIKRPVYYKLLKLRVYNPHTPSTQYWIHP